MLGLARRERETSEGIGYYLLEMKKLKLIVMLLASGLSMQTQHRSWSYIILCASISSNAAHVPSQTG